MSTIRPKHFIRTNTIFFFLCFHIPFFCLSLQGSMSSGHRLRDVEQQHPLLDREEAAAGSAVGEAERVWFIQDGCGMVCAFITWFLVLYADFVVTFVMLLPSKSFWYAVVNGVVFNCLAVLALTSHLRTMLTDPVSELTTAGPRSLGPTVAKKRGCVVMLGDLKKRVTLNGGQDGPYKQ